MFRPIPIAVLFLLSALALDCLLADSHPPYTAEWLMKNSELVAIVRFEEVTRTTLTPINSDHYSRFESTVEIIQAFKSTERAKTIKLEHYRWAKENTKSLANPSFAELQPELLTQLDSLEIGETANVKQGGYLALVFLVRDGERYKAVTRYHEKYSIQGLLGRFDQLP